MSSDRLAAVYMLTGTLVVWVAWIKGLRPRWRKLSRRVSGALDTLGGREPIVDVESGKELAKRLPPLGERLGNIEDALTRLADVHTRLDVHEQKLGEHQTAIAALIASTFERGANAALDAERAKNEGVVDVESPPG